MVEHFTTCPIAQGTGTDCRCQSVPDAHEFYAAVCVLTDVYGTDTVIQGSVTMAEVFKVERRRVVFDAAQYRNADSWPTGVQRAPGNDARAYVLDRDGEMVTVDEGDWVVRNGDAVWVVPKDQFHERYLVVDYPDAATDQ